MFFLLKILEFHIFQHTYFTQVSKRIMANEVYLLFVVKYLFLIWKLPVSSIHPDIDFCD